MDWKLSPLINSGKKIPGYKWFHIFYFNQGPLQSAHELLIIPKPL